jgi:hypothetical protein
MFISSVAVKWLLVRQYVYFWFGSMWRWHQGACLMVIGYGGNGGDADLAKYRSKSF